MRALLDVNVLVALLDPLHVSHVIVNRWLDGHVAAGWASCPLTENGCLRVSTGSRYSNPLSVGVALAKLKETKNKANHVFWSDDLSITDSAAFDWTLLQGHQQITDVYLLALAVARGGKLVTLDRRIRGTVVVGCGSEHLVML